MLIISPAPDRQRRLSRFEAIEGVPSIRRITVRQ